MDKQFEAQRVNQRQHVIRGTVLGEDGFEEITRIPPHGYAVIDLDTGKPLHRIEEDGFTHWAIYPQKQYATVAVRQIAREGVESLWPNVWQTRTR